MKLRISPMARGLALAFGGLAAALPASQVMAQQQQQQLERVEITGSRIRRVDAETAAPVTVISREEIERTGMQNVSDVVRSLAVDNNGSIPTAFGSGFAAGASAVSLRGLGVNSTLVLLNGRRLAPYGLADDGQRNFTDLSSIPMDAVDRIEVLKDGASAIYGSDAVGGVINIILRSTFQGAIANVSAGKTSEGDGNNWRGTFTAGFGDLAKDRYNVFFNVEMSAQQAIFERDRKDRGLMFNQDMSLAGYDYLEFAQYGILIPGAAIVGGPSGAVRAPSGGFNYKFLPCAPGSNQPLSASAIGQYPDLTNNFSSQNGGPASCVSNSFDYFMVQPDEERLNLYTRGTYQLNQNWQVYGEASRFQTNVKTFFNLASVSSAWPDAQNNTLKNNAAITIGANHPDNPFPGTANRLRYHFGDRGGRDQELETVQTRLLAGVRGSAYNWDIDAGLMYAQSETNQKRFNYLRNSTLRDYLNGTNVTGLNPTNTYYRLGANAGLNSQATYDAISPVLDNDSKTKITLVDVKGSRELMQLAGGPMGIALGAEYRKEELDSPPTPYTDTADIIGLGFAAFNSSRNVYALYGEVVAPVLKGLELSAALRYDNYSDYGNSVTPKVGARWQPMQQLVLRATYAEAFRAPGAAESGNSSSAGFTSFRDPLLCPITNAAADCSGTAIVSAIGNPAIKPEESKSYTLGFVLEPWQTTNLSVDYWKVDRTNEISQPDLQQILNNPASIPNTQIIRQDDGRGALGPNGEFALAGVLSPYFNANSTKTDGIDIDLRQRFSLGGWGQLNAMLVWTHILSFERQFPDGTTLEYAGSHGPTVLSGNGGMPKDRAAVTLSWDYSTVTTSLRWNYVSSMKNKETADDVDCLNHFFDGTDAPGGCKIPSFDTWDLFLRWAPMKNLEVYGSIRNLLDDNPPYDPQVYSAFHYNPIYHLQGAIGRSYNVGVKYTFK